MRGDLVCQLGGRVPVGKVVLKVDDSVTSFLAKLLLNGIKSFVAFTLATRGDEQLRDAVGEQSVCRAVADALISGQW